MNCVACKHTRVPRVHETAATHLGKPGSTSHTFELSGSHGRGVAILVAKIAQQAVSVPSFAWAMQDWVYAWMRRARRSSNPPIPPLYPVRMACGDFTACKILSSSWEIKGPTVTLAKVTTYVDRLYPHVQDHESACYIKNKSCGRAQ